MLLGPQPPAPKEWSRSQSSANICRGSNEIWGNHLQVPKSTCSRFCGCPVHQRATIRMPRQIDAVYENGVLRPLQPLDLKEHEHVLVSVVKVAATGRSSLAVDYIETIKREMADAEPAPGLEEVRRRLAKIPGSMAAETVADRGER